MDDVTGGREPSAAARFRAALFDRAADKPPARAPDLVLSVEDRPPWPTLIGLALQQMALQSIYFVLPALAASAFDADALGVTNLLCLSLIGVALYGALQALTQGPVGSGYPVPGIPTPVLLMAYLLADAMGATPGQAAALTLLTGLFAMAAVPLLRRLDSVIPTEVAGVVVFLIGASLLPVVMETLHLDPAHPEAATAGVGLAAASFAAMVLLALSRSRLAPLAVLYGALIGTAFALALGLGNPGAGAVLAQAPWFALPQPIWPEFSGLDPTLLLTFLVCLIPSKAALLGNLIAFQRAMDADWRRPDAPPLRRGLLAQGLALALTGAIGGFGPGSSSACVGLAIATRTLARRVALAGAAMLLALAFCPKLVALFVLVPEPVRAAMLLYVAGFMMAQGCQTLVTRMLDARRTVVVGLGLSAGLAVLIAPGFFRAVLPAMASPLALGALVAVAANLVTLPLVVRRARFILLLRAGAADVVAARCAELGGAWGLRRATMEQVEHALIELCDLLAGRGLQEAVLTARMLETRLEVVIGFAGPPLPKPSRRPRAEDLESGPAAFEAFGMWLATRQAARHGQRRTGEGQELWLEFED